MNSHIQIDIARSERGPLFQRSHVLHPHEGMNIVYMVRAPKMNVLSVVEDNLLESISSTEWHYDDEETDFSYVSERHNHFL